MTNTDLNKSVKEWNTAWQVIVEVLKELHVPNADHNAAAIIARLSGKNMLIVFADEAKSVEQILLSDEFHAKLIDAFMNAKLPELTVGVKQI
jgi:hypothetical protein